MLVINDDIKVCNNGTDEDQSFISVNIYTDKGEYYTTLRMYLPDLFKYGITAFAISDKKIPLEE